jgi:hypothetical protein
MNKLRLFSVLRSGLLIVLTVLLLTGATGLSYKVHFCHGRLSGVAFYTEIGLQKMASCGCKDDQAPLSGHRSPVLHKNGCCSNLSFFQKLQIENRVNTGDQVVSPVPELCPAVAVMLPESGIKEDGSFFVFSEPPPPPLSGRKLVLFLSQQRIPLIS